MESLPFGQVVETWDQAVLLVELDGTVSGWNPAAKRITPMRTPLSASGASVRVKSWPS